MAARKSGPSKTRRGSRKTGSLKNSVILMLVLLCLFFATGTDSWTIAQVQHMAVAVGLVNDAAEADLSMNRGADEESGEQTETEPDDTEQP